MKKSLSIVMALVVIVSLLPCVSTAAASSAASAVPQHVAQDFEDGWDPASGVLSGNSTATWTDQNTHNNSRGALEFSTTGSYTSIAFPIRTEVGNSYDISAWVRVNELPKSQWATFIIYNKGTDGTGKMWNQFTAHHDVDFQVGEWVLLTATYTPTGKGTTNYEGKAIQKDVVPDGTIEIRLGSGIPSDVTGSDTISFAIDDFFVIPTVNNDTKTESNLFKNGGFDTEEEFSAAWQPLSKGTSKVTYLADDGANGTTGAAKIEATALWGTMKPKDLIDLELCKHYKLSFWAKALNEDALNRSMWGYFTFSGDKDASISNYLHLTNGANPTLTNDWQLFEFDVYANYIVEKTPDVTFCFRVGTNSELQEDKILPCYAVDEVSLTQTDGDKFDISAEIYGAFNYTNEFLLQLAFIDSTKGSFLYKLVKETENGDRYITCGTTKDGSLVLNREDDETDGRYRLDVVGIDAYGHYSDVHSCYLDENSPTDSATLRADQYLWNDDVKTLSATLSYQNETEQTAVKAVAALYAKNGALIGVKENTAEIAAGETKTCPVSVGADPEAETVRFFAWYGDSMTPITYQSELKKTTSGEFIYVDANSTAAEETGTFEQPFKTLELAITKLQGRLLVSSETDIYIVLKSGEYTPKDYKTLALGKNECSETKNVIFTSLEGEKAKITGAMHVSGFTLYDSDLNIYRAAVPEGTNSRQLYVNGVKATRARTVEDPVGFTNLDQGKKGDDFLNEGIVCTDTSYLNYKYPTELEMAFTQNWRHQTVMVDSISETEDGLVHFGFEDGKNASKWKELTSTSNTPATLPVYLENALELLDEEGEWYLDTHENYVYYKPRYFENINTADVVIPAMEKLVTVKGTTSAPRKNISFNYIDFEYATWNYPTTNRGFLNGQNATYSNGEGGQLMNGAVELENARNINFDGCDFSKIGSIALRMTGAVQNCSVIGNEFYEISGTAIAVGDVGGKWDVRYPTDEKNYLTDILVANNYIHKVATDFNSAAAISAGFPKNTVIRNNELTDGSYSGMHTGWGWGSTAPSGTENFVIEKNYIHDFMNWRLYDGAGIYTLGNTGGTEENPNRIYRNYFKDMKNHYGDIYPDEGSTYWKISENVIDQKSYPVHYGRESSGASVTWLHIWTSTIHHIYVEDNYSTTSHHRNDGSEISYEAPEIYADANWPSEALQIINESGVEPAYRNRFDFNLQMLTLPRRIDVSAGDSVPLLYNGITSKDKLCNLSDFEIRAKSSNPEVATATSNAVTGVSAGKAWITLELCKRENGEVQYYDEHTFYVIVN